MNLRALVRAILTLMILTAPLPDGTWAGVGVVAAQDEGGRLDLR